jgi:DNA-binding MarR family transcriptional regulator
MREPLERLFLRDKPVSAILAVGEMENAYAALVARRIDSTVPHTCGILRELEEEGLITSRPEGRINHLELTARGQVVASALSHLQELLKGPDALRVRLDRLRQMASRAEGSNPAFCLGPLRRDLARLMSQGDKALCRDAEELDATIASQLQALQ